MSHNDRQGESREMGWWLGTMMVSHGRIVEEGVAESVEPKDAEPPRTADVPAAGRLLGVSSRPRIAAIGRSILSLLIVIGLHAGLLAGLLQYRPQSPLPFQAPTPMMVSLVSSPVPQPQPAAASPAPTPVEPDPKPLPPQPKPKPKKVVRPVKKPAPRPNAIQVPVQAEIAAPPKPAASGAVQGSPTEAPSEPVLQKFSADYLKNPSPDYPLASRRLRPPSETGCSFPQSSAINRSAPGSSYPSYLP